MQSVSEFYNNHKVLCIATLGLAVVGFLAYRSVRQILEKLGLVKKVDEIAQNRFGQTDGLGGTVEPSPVPPPETAFQPVRQPEPVSQGVRLRAAIGNPIQNHDLLNPIHPTRLEIAGLPSNDPKEFLNIRNTLTINQVNEIMNAGSIVPKIGSFLFAYQQDVEPINSFPPILLERTLNINYPREYINRLVERAQRTYNHNVANIKTNLDGRNIAVPDRLPQNWEVSSSLTVYGQLEDNVRYSVYFQGWLFDHAKRSSDTFNGMLINMPGLAYFQDPTGIIPNNDEGFITNEFRFFEQHAHDERDENGVQADVNAPYLLGAYPSQVQFQGNTPAKLCVVCVDPIKGRIHFSYIFANQPTYGDMTLTQFGEDFLRQHGNDLLIRFE